MKLDFPQYLEARYTTFKDVVRDEDVVSILFDNFNIAIERDEEGYFGYADC